MVFYSYNWAREMSTHTYLFYESQKWAMPQRRFSCEEVGSGYPQTFDFPFCNAFFDNSLQKVATT
jgi:hypothetical protein